METCAETTVQCWRLILDACAGVYFAFTGGAKCHGYDYKHSSHTSYSIRPPTINMAATQKPYRNRSEPQCQPFWNIRHDSMARILDTSRSRCINRIELVVVGVLFSPTWRLPHSRRLTGQLAAVLRARCCSIDCNDARWDDGVGSRSRSRAYCGCSAD